MQYKMKSAIGNLYLVASEKGLRGIHWKKQDSPFIKDLDSKKVETLILKKAVKEIEEFLEGKRKKFSLNLDIIGTEFQKKVWKTLQTIPYGKTWSYKELAVKVGNSNASRAVGTANGKNPLSLIIPCHRVISSDGGLGGYAGGLKIKTKLLDIERRVLR